MQPLPYEVVRTRRETKDTVTLELEPCGETIARDEPGQFNMLYVFGRGEVPISISGASGDGKTIIHTTRAVGSVTDHICSLKKGARMGVRGPYGTHWPVVESFGADLVIVAGGIGLAPLRPAMRVALANRDRFGRIVLLYGSRMPEDLLFRQELEAWRSRLDLEVLVTVDRGDESWRGSVGVVTKLISKATFDPEDTVAMVCGPEVMMRFTVMELLQKGVEPGNLYMSMERNMECGIGLCGHCQFGSEFVCKDGPVFRYPDIRDSLSRWEI
jgi:NAD(P)H-flavin reductase